MKNFIELSFRKEKILINANYIVTIKPYESGSGFDKSDLLCSVLVSDINGSISNWYNVEESHNQIKELIEQALD
jgi:hypothetical protein